MMKTKIYFILLLILLCWSEYMNAYQIFPLEIAKDGKILFQLDYPEAEKVTLAGNFNNWDKNAMPLKRDEMGIWCIAITLSPGDYEYKFVVNENNWIPSENIKFTIKIYKNRLIIEGGEGFTALYEKKSNIPVSDKIFVKGNYKFIFIPYYDIETKEGKILKNRHILEFYPDIYINENVIAYVNLIFDSHNLYDGFNYLALWRTLIALNANIFTLKLFYNKKCFFMDDPLLSLNEYIYISEYPDFNYPIEFYNVSTYNKKFGDNYRGIILNVKTGSIELKSIYSRLSFVFSEYLNDYTELLNFDIGAGIIRYNFKTGKIGLIGLAKKGKYLNYPESEDNWIKLFNLDTYYQVAPRTLYKESDEYSLYKTGIETYLKLNRFACIFGEYLAIKKQGGYYLQTITSDGKDLPQDYPEYSVNYTKYAHIYRTSYNGNEFIIGTHLFITKYLKHELSFSLKSINFLPQFLENITPRIWKYKIITKLNLNRINIDNEVKLISGDEKPRYYNYEFLFDENNFSGIFLSGCYKKFVFRNNIDIKISHKFRIAVKNWFNRYYQRDIFFNESQKWESNTLENWGLGYYDFKKFVQFQVGIRVKYYDFSQLIKQKVFYSFNKIYFNPYIGVLYKISQNIEISAGYGIQPSVEPRYFDGFNYYLDENITRNFPFFKDAENKLSKIHCITLKGEMRF